MNEAWSAFSGRDEPYDFETPDQSLFMSWFQFHWRPDDYSAVDEPLRGRVPIDVYLERMGRNVDPAARRYLEACVKGYLSFQECLRSDSGRGYRARDLFTGRECYVMERLTSEHIQAGDLIFAYVVDVDGITMIDGAGACLLPPIRKIELLELRQALLSDHAHCTPEELKGLEEELIDRYLDIAEELSQPADSGFAQYGWRPHRDAPSVLRHRIAGAGHPRARGPRFEPHGR